MKTTLGGDRLGSGNKQEIAMKNYERSSHDLGYVWRSSMSSGTIVPFMSEVGLPGDSFDIDLDVDVKTLPTIGPLFGSYKVQLDVFQAPVRLYQGKLHMNMLNIGMDMGEVLLPQIKMEADYKNKAGDNSQINSSSIYSYLNMRGLGRHTASGTDGKVERVFNGVPYLAYWDVYKNYYADKQIEKGYVIHSGQLNNDFVVTSAKVVVRTVTGGLDVITDITNGPAQVNTSATNATGVSYIQTLEWNGPGDAYGEPDITGASVDIAGQVYELSTLFVTVAGSGLSAVTVTPDVNQPGYSAGVRNKWILTANGIAGQGAGLYAGPQGKFDWGVAQTIFENTLPAGYGPPQLQEFPLENIDDMRMQLLENVRSTVAYEINDQTLSPYGLGLGSDTEGQYYKLSSQEGLGIKTYQSDLFNNWISTEWIDGSNGVNEITSVDTTSGAFTIDTLNLANKVYNMLNRIALSGGSYDDWLDAVYTHERSKGHENPIYMGSLIKELGFEETVSQAESSVEGNTQPLGTLAGRGRMMGKQKGGKIKIKVDEVSVILGVISLTPRIDYSQGNKWDTGLKTMDDYHKPALDEIGFQDLITDQMAWFDSSIDPTTNKITYKSAGKQPAWVNYMTNVNQTRGNFAEEEGMFMTLNRRYTEGVGSEGIKDLSTYIDPSKFNNIFAQEDLSSQNFWVQVKSDIFARRKMSAKVIPNL